MYANLRVTTSRGRTLHAWKVEVTPDATTVYLDKNDGQSNYAEEGGALTLRGALTVEADY